MINVQQGMGIGTIRVEPDFDCKVIDPDPPLNILVPEYKGEMGFLHIFPEFFFD